MKDSLAIFVGSFNLWLIIACGEVVYDKPELFWPALLMALCSLAVLVTSVLLLFSIVEIRVKRKDTLSVNFEMDTKLEGPIYYLKRGLGK